MRLLHQGMRREPNAGSRRLVPRPAIVFGWRVLARNGLIVGTLHPGWMVDGADVKIRTYKRFGALLALASVFVVLSSILVAAHRRADTWSASTIGLIGLSALAAGALSLVAALSVPIALECTDDEILVGTALATRRYRYARLVKLPGGSREPGVTFSARNGDFQVRFDFGDAVVQHFPLAPQDALAVHQLIASKLEAMRCRASTEVAAPPVALSQGT
jgi:hypothetical protein